eukprot:761648-Amphidinium_carterae.1
MAQRPSRCRSGLDRGHLCLQASAHCDFRKATALGGASFVGGWRFEGQLHQPQESALLSGQGWAHCRHHSGHPSLPHHA